MENCNLIGAVFAPSIVALSQENNGSLDFAIVIQRLVEYFLRLCSMELTFAGITFTFGSAFVWCALVGLVVKFWTDLKGD